MIQQGIVYTAYGKGKSALIAAEDHGRVIAAILQKPVQHAGKTYPLFGPVEMTFEEIIHEVGRVLQRPLRHQQVPFEAMMQSFASQAGKVARNDSFSGYAETSAPDASGQSFQSQHLREAANDHHNGLFAGTNDLVERITGRKPKSISEYVQENRVAFAA